MMPSAVQPLCWSLATTMRQLPFAETDDRVLTAPIPGELYIDHGALSC